MSIVTQFYKKKKFKNLITLKEIERSNNPFKKVVENLNFGIS